MDIITTPPYEELQALYTKYFSLDSLGADITNKFALISLVCYITDKVKKKKPDWTHWKTLYEIDKGKSSENFLKGLAVICSDFAYGCATFPTFGIEDKKIPAKIKELLDNRLPF
jgi:hypothetical protein